MSDLQVGDRVVVVFDGRKIAGTVRSVTPPRWLDPALSVHVDLDEAHEMFITRWCRAEDVTRLPSR